VVHEHPWVVFPGNTQGRSVRECGPKGCSLVTVDGDSVVSVEHRELDVVRWQVVQVDVSGLAGAHDVVQAALAGMRDAIDSSADRLLALRLELDGACRAHRELAKDPLLWDRHIRALATDLGGDRLWLEKIMMRTRTEVDLEEMAARDDAMGSLLRAVLDLDGVTLEGMTLDNLFDDLRARLASSLGAEAPRLVVDDPDRLAAVLEDVKQVLVARLVEFGSDP
jgi:hypothetical protein